jgi:Type II secretion system (T2SS), protein K
MKLLRPRSRETSRAREGAALLLSLMILLVLVAIVIQINVSTGTDARVARNDVGLTGMDLAAESALLQVYDKLKTDAEDSSSSAGGAGGTGATPPAGTDPANPPPSAGSSGTPAPGAQQQQPCDSRRDDWATPQRTEINEFKIRIVIQDEDSKYNVLNMLNPDPTLAQEAFDRVVKILDLCREGTTADIDPNTASQMAKAMLEHMTKRKVSKLPRPKLITDSDDPNNDDQGLPLSLKEFAVLPPFDESHFRDFRDENDKIVHSIGSFLTVWSSIGLASDKAKADAAAAAAAANAADGNPKGTSSSSTSSSSSSTSSADAAPSTTITDSIANSSSSTSSSSSSSSSGSSTSGTGQSTPGSGGASGGKKVSDTAGYAVNVNTAPPAVLKSLFDDRVLNPSFWDKVVEYRNLEDETEKQQQQDQASTTAEQPALDEYGNPIIKRNIFDALSKLNEVDGYKDLDTTVQAKLNQVLTVQSHVFSIYVITRRSTSVDGETADAITDPKERRLAEQKGDSLVRVVRSVVWRHHLDDKVEIVPIVRWEQLDYEPWEVLDYPDDER